MKDNVGLERAVVLAVARSEGIEPAALREPLFDALDGDALDRLFRDTTGHVTFEYQGYEVTVSSDGDVSLEPSVE
ncbi:hypothetical protein NDI56_01070 [Haloarcula sp. S1CR25-12]|uniref:Halobacterial output domain-containing protein n=1 Tax=Haloarcula saliterrae TaxID=2950534 RepID=A0ABU2F6W5_9EURY|nr:HalOD1 output domain-containing protein [Haloarcula sp. S1CR25-12]MDS0257994.1 hypothetical protein [Haloarcula sp. S1CR25-12]